eukprot:TRINITY_DN764_c0_g7_i1.p1 TRINITY_DN764_c0_g7~~TRINITY_DN764_c0_g7_i1.p1  ORF type:complete len:540 (-),score=92.48 TRINITY_DN764_c0_g7_i1:223-1842(-)
MFQFIVFVFFLLAQTIDSINSDLSQSLEKGGLIVYFRHTVATTCDDIPGRVLGYANVTTSPSWWKSCTPNCSVECDDYMTRCDNAVCRQLDLYGIQLASKIATALTYAPWKWDRVYAGEFCRTVTTAQLLFPDKEVKTLPQLTDWVYSNQFDRCEKLVELLMGNNTRSVISANGVSSPTDPFTIPLPAEGQNIAIVGDGRLPRIPYPTNTPQYELCSAVNKLRQMSFFIYNPATRAITYSNTLGTILLDLTPINSLYIQPFSSSAIAVCVITFIAILLAIACHVYMCTYSDMSVLSSASPFFLHLIMIGCVMCYVSVFLMIGEPTVGLCVSQIWMLFMGVIVSFSTLIAKNWRIWRLFYAPPVKMNVVLTDVDLLKYLSIIWIVFCIILTVWSVLFTPRPTLMTSFDGQTITVCSGEPYMFYVAVIGVGITAIVGVIVAIKARNLPEKFRETQWIALGTYNFVICSLLTVPVALGIRVNYLNLSFVILSMGIVVWSSGIWMFLILPKFYKIMKGEREKVGSRMTPTAHTMGIPHDAATS